MPQAKGPHRCRPFACPGAVERSRTSDLLITNQLLYQLSYNGKTGDTEVAREMRRPTH